MPKLTQEEKDAIIKKVNEKKANGMQGTTIAPITQTVDSTVVEDLQPLDIVEDRTPEQIQADIDYIEEVSNFVGNTSLVTQDAIELQTVEGMRFLPNMTEDEKEEMYESISSYIGVIPKACDEYIGQWLVCKGAVVQPITSTDEESGEVKNWVKPLFKVIDPEHNHEIIIAGGGKYGLEFARNMTSMFGAGDWTRAKVIRITQEARQGTNKETGQPEPHRLYRFNFLTMKSYERMKGNKNA
jgi:hypothetical protein